MQKRRTILKKTSFDLEDEDQIDMIERGIASKEFQKLEKLTG